MPRWDKNPVNRAQAAARIQYESYSSSPQSVLERDLKGLTRGLDPRLKTPTPAEIAATTPEGSEPIAEEATLASAGPGPSSPAATTGAPLISSSQPTWQLRTPSRWPRWPTRSSCPLQTFPSKRTVGPISSSPPLPPALSWGHKPAK